MLQPFYPGLDWQLKLSKYRRVQNERLVNFTNIAKYDIRAAAACQCIRACISLYNVIIFFTESDVIAASTKDRIIAVASDNRIVTVVAVEIVVSVPTTDEVVATFPP